MVSPVLAPVWIAGLAAPFRRAELRTLRFVPVAYGVLAAAYLVGNGKAYYLASIYPALLGVGAVVVAGWRVRTRWWWVAIGLSAAVSAVIALPLLPPRSLQGSVPLAINPDLGEQVGWPRFVDQVAYAWRALPPPVRDRTAIFTGNYGEAGAIAVLGGAHGLPRPYSGHNGFSEWGAPPPADDRALVLGYDDPAELAGRLAGCRQLARIDNGVGLDNDEQGMPILLCRPTASWRSLWPALTHFN
jgi:hypothetical protein